MQNSMYTTNSTITKGMNINVRDRSCTNYSKIDDFTQKVKSNIGSKHKNSKLHLLDSRIATMEKSFLTVTKDENLMLQFDKNGSLLYGGRTFFKVSIS